MKISLKLEKEKLYQYLFIYLMIQFIGGRVSVALGSDIFVGSCLVVSVLYMFFHPNLVSKNKPFLAYLTVIFSAMIITILYTLGGLSIGSSLSVIARFLVVFVAININISKFVERYLKIAFMFACISIAIYAFVQLVGHETAKMFLSKLYEIPSGNAWTGSSYGLLLVAFNYIDPSRNAYMFGEAGEYQMLIVLAIYFVVFQKTLFLDKRNKIRYFLIFLFTMVTIGSTTGFLNLIVLLCCILLSRKRSVSKISKQATIFVLVLFFTYLLFGLSNDSFVYTQFINKIFNTQMKFDLSASTGSDRVKAVLLLLDIVKYSPTSLITGVGYNGLVALIGEFTCSGIVNSIIMFGVFTCLILYGWIVLPIIKYSKSIFEVIFLVFMIINNGLSQPDILAVTTVIVACYYYFYPRLERKNLHSS